MPPTSMEDYSYACSYCSQRYLSQRDLDIHEYMHGNYSMEAIFDLAVQPRISYMTYDYFTYECRGIVSGVFGQESGCALTPEQDYKYETTSENSDLFSKSQSLIRICKPKGRQNFKFVNQPVKTNFISANQPTPKYTSFVQPLSPSYTPPVQRLGSSHAPPVQPLGSSHTPPVQPFGSSYTPPVQPPSSSHTPPVQRLGSSHTPPVHRFGSTHTPPLQPPCSSHTLPVQRLGSNYTPPAQTLVQTPPIQPPSPSYTPPVQQLAPGYTPENQPNQKSGLPLLDQHSVCRCERFSMERVKNTILTEEMAATPSADLTIKCQTSFLSSACYKSNLKTFHNDIPSCITEQGFTIESIRRNSVGIS